MVYQVEYAAVCHSGRLRPSNQDNYFCNGRYLPAERGGPPGMLSGYAASDQPALFAVFDGMGGEERGEMASFLAAETMNGGEWEDLAEACRAANRRIVRFTKENRLNTCGTTAAMLLFDENGVVQCHIGDSRIYRLREGWIDQLTEDDVFPVNGRRKAPLLQFLGIPEEEMRIEPHIRRYEAVAGDTYLICSDGLSDMVSAHDMAETIQKRAIREAGELLLRDALDAGGRDNITFFLLRIT